MQILDQDIKRTADERQYSRGQASLVKTGVISAAIALVEVERGEDADRRGADRELRCWEVRLNLAALLSMSQLEVGV